MPTLILSPRYTEDSQQLWQAAVRQGWSVERLHGWQVSERLRAAGEPVLYIDGLLSHWSFAIPCRDSAIILRATDDRRPTTDDSIPFLRNPFNLLPKSADSDDRRET